MDTNIPIVTDEHQQLAERLLKLATRRALGRAYQGFSEEAKKEMEAVFGEKRNEEKEAFIQKQIPNFPELLQEELQQLEKEVEEEMKKED